MKLCQEGNNPSSPSFRPISGAVTLTRERMGLKCCRQFGSGTPDPTYVMKSNFIFGMLKKKTYRYQVFRPLLIPQALKGCSLCLFYTAEKLATDCYQLPHVSVWNYFCPEDFCLLMSWEPLHEKRRRETKPCLQDISTYWLQKRNYNDN